MLRKMFIQSVPQAAQKNGGGGGGGGSQKVFFGSLGLSFI